MVAFISKHISRDYAKVLVIKYLTYLFKDEAQTALFKGSAYRAVNTFHLGYKNQSVYAISGTSRCLFSDKYKTHKYSVGRAYSC
jgi:hypothetical protein